MLEVIAVIVWKVFPPLYLFVSGAYFGYRLRQSRERKERNGW